MTVKYNIVKIIEEKNMAKEKKQGLVKDKKVYKRARNIAIVFTSLFALVMAGGIALGIYSAEKTSDIFSEYIRNGEYREIYMQDIAKIDKDLEEGKISFNEYSKKFFYMRSNNYAYVYDNLLRSDSEIRQKNDKNNTILVSGIAAMTVGLVGAIGSATAASAQDDHYQDELELEKINKKKEDENE